jgi:CubicO group peptidase (beta-lactamase class C family)
VPADREITLKDLLTHTAGLGTFLGVRPTAPVTKNETLADRIPLLGSAPLDFQPGTRWSYSPLDGFDVLLRIVEIVSGMSADDFMRTRLFEPLGMTDTVFHLSAEQQQRLVPLYARKENAWTPGMDILGAGDPAMKYLSGSGGILSTAHDYMQFEEMLLNRGELNGRRLLKPETVALMSSNHVGLLFEQFPIFGRKGWGFGLGVGIVLDPVAANSGRGRGSFGWDGAHGTDAWVDPEHDLAVVYCVQQSVAPALADFGNAIGKAIVA